MGEKFGKFGIGGLTGDGAAVEGANDLLGRLFLLEHFIDNFSSLDAVVNGVTIEEVEGLREVGFHFDLTGADRLASGTAEGGEEVGGGIPIGDLDGASAEGETLEFIGRVGCLGEGVEEDFCAEATNAAVGEVGVIVLVRFVDLSGELVGA